MRRARGRSTRVRFRRLGGLRRVHIWSAGEVLSDGARTAFLGAPAVGAGAGLGDFRLTFRGGPLVTGAVERRGVPPSIRLSCKGPKRS